ncbi:MAG: hypothetical protein OXH99_10700, partial [Bryobacterales bacterium]|nr:hypothetical protein [Bryobacterales bacterium]
HLRIFRYTSLPTGSAEEPDFEVSIILCLGLQELPLDIGGDGLLGQALILELGLEIRQVNLGFFRLGRTLQLFLFNLRAAQFRQGCSATDRLAGPDKTSLDTSGLACRDHHHGLGHKGANAPHLPHHPTERDRVGEDNGSVRTQCRRLNARHRPDHGQERD